MPSLLDDLRPADLQSEGLRFIAETAGMDLVRTLIKHFPGMRIEIPVRPNREVIKRYIEVNYDGKNTDLIACRMGVTSRYVRKLLGEKSAFRPAGREAA